MAETCEMVGSRNERGFAIGDKVYEVHLVNHVYQRHITIRHCSRVSIARLSNSRLTWRIADPGAGVSADPAEAFAVPLSQIICTATHMRYAHLATDPLKKAADEIATRIDTAMKKRPKVVPIRG